MSLADMETVSIQFLQDAVNLVSSPPLLYFVTIAIFCGLVTTLYRLMSLKRG